MCSNQLSYVAKILLYFRWLGYLDSNQGMPVSKPVPYRWRAPQYRRGEPQTSKIWLGYLDSNQGMPVSKTGALPLGDTPNQKSLPQRERVNGGREDLNSHTLRRQSHKSGASTNFPHPKDGG